MYLNTSFEVVVLSTLDEHHHEEDPEFSTKENYHWTVQQEKVPPPIPQQQNPVNFLVFIINPDCGSILGDAHKQHHDPGGAELVQPGQWKWKPTQPLAGDDLLISSICSKF